MTKNLLKIQLFSSQQDSIPEQSTDSALLSAKNTLPVQHKNSEKDSLIRLIEQGYDATSYYYVNWQDDVPLADYFLQPEIFKKPVTKTFAEKKQQTERTVNKPSVTIKESDVLLLILLVLFSLIAYVRISTKDYIRKISISVFSFAYSRTLFNEHTKLLWIKDFILLSVFYVSAGILAKELFLYFNPQTNLNINELQYWASLIIFGLIFSYQIIIRIIGVLSLSSRVVSEYLFYFNNSLKFLGVFNLIALFILIYGADFIQFYLIYLIFFVYVSIYLLRVYKIVSDFLINRFSLFYFILYFCALEIVPIMMLIKYFFALGGIKFAV